MRHKPEVENPRWRLDGWISDFRFGQTTIVRSGNELRLCCVEKRSIDPVENAALIENATSVSYTSFQCYRLSNHLAAFMGGR